MMNFQRIILISLALSTLAVSCKKEEANRWQVEIKEPSAKVEIIDISKEYYNTEIPLEEFKEKYPWFQGTVTDAEYEERRKDKEEAKIYEDAISKLNIQKLSKDLAGLFSHIKYYFPDFKQPKVFLYSSALQSATNPIAYISTENLLFIDISGFMGKDNAHYKGLELYFQKSMNPSNLLSKISYAFAEYFVPYSPNDRTFISRMIYEGKLLTLQDAFLPNEPDYLKMNYTQEQYDWCSTYENNIWNFFVENDLVFSDDQRLSERFIAPAPFSKFYTEIDNESSPQVGTFIGWEICRAFLKAKPDISLQDFLKIKGEEIFKESKYNGK
ncbi:MAG: gliding motility protein GldB [Bergeyella cardium]